MFSKYERKSHIALACEELRTQHYPTVSVHTIDNSAGFNLKRTTPFQRAVARAKRKVLYNVYKYDKKFDWFQTFTFADPAPSESEARKIWSNFIRELRRYPRYRAKRFGYFSRMERGEKRGRLHFHVLFTRVPNKAKLLALWIGAGGGWISHGKPLLSQEDVVSYILKYCSKSVGKSHYRLFNERIRGRRFFYSQGLNCVPEWLDTQFVKAMREHENKKTHKLELREEIIGIETKCKYEVAMPCSTVLCLQPTMIMNRIPVQMVNIYQKENLINQLRGIDERKYDYVRLPEDPFLENQIGWEKDDLRQLKDFTLFHRVKNRLNAQIKISKIRIAELIKKCIEFLDEKEAPAWVYEYFSKCDINKKIKWAFTGYWLNSSKPKKILPYGVK